MSRTLRALVIVLLAASCGGGGSKTAPQNLDNACELVRERPQYYRAFKDAERKWGVPVHVQMATIHQESKFVGDARTPFTYALGVIPTGRMSSAFGYSQALDGTWEEYQEQHGGRRTKRDDIRHATDFMGWYMRQTRDQLGIPLWDARNQYLAYHEGRGGYRSGSYYAKSWLMRVADKVQARSQMYQAQLANCRYAR
ncbi:transglycosylase SLT domain-containing protein [Litorisediminicola beolgyonensis]|uniref:Lytic transglycosylase n=1 Tax=Litorisediminicola beolgyonensis TaxID=1173614 RepID=A0ABW3ZCN6_9RHOB